MKRLFSSRGFMNSCRYAWAGVGYLWRNELSFRIHFMVGTLAILAGAILKINMLEWVAISICITIVMAAEAFNTAFELLADALHPDENEMIGRAKDICAGAVLLVALAALATGLIIYLPKMATLFGLVTQK